MNTTEETTRIIDIGRGPQLSGHRITVQDMLPFFKNGMHDDEILRWHPTIVQFELDLLRQYYLDHTEEVLALEKRIEERNAELRKRYAQPPSPMDLLPVEERPAYLKAKLAARLEKERNGVPNPSR